MTTNIVTCDTERNVESSPVNAQSNATRQKAYRDRQRGGPPVGRWPDGAWRGNSVRQACETVGIGRTSLYMYKWLKRHAPQDVWDALNKHRAKIKPAPTYRKLRRQMEAEFFAAMEAEERGENPWPEFVAKWNPRPSDVPPV